MVDCVPSTARPRQGATKEAPLACLPSSLPTKQMGQPTPVDGFPVPEYWISDGFSDHGCSEMVLGSVCCLLL